MNTTDASVIIKNFIEEWYQCIFLGEVQIVQLSEDTYNLRLKLNQKDIPLNYTVQTDSIEDFIEKTKDQLKRMRLTNVEYYSGFKYESRRNNKNN